MSLPVKLRSTLVKHAGTKCAICLAVLVLGSSLIAVGACRDSEAAGVAHTIPTAERLLSGAKPADSDFYVTVGFRLAQNTIQLDARPGSASSTETFILDSGAPMTISPRLARELDLKPLASIALAGPEGSHQRVPVTRIPEITIGGLEFHDVGAVVDWVEPPNELACLSTAGLMGASLLQTAIWQIDFQTEKMIITNSLTRLRGLPDAMKIPFRRSDAAGSPRISVGVSDADQVSLLVDLGFNGSIAIPTALLEQSGDRIPDEAPTEEGQGSSTVFGAASSELRIARMRELRLGDLRLKNFPAVTGTAVSDFHVGIEFLRHFRLTIDWLGNYLYLEPNHQKSALYPDFASYGLTPKLHDGALVVGSIWRGSAAERAGMEPGDRLVELGGHKTKTADFATLCDLLNAVGLFGTNNAPISVTWIHNGQRETSQVARTPLLPEYGNGDF